MMAKERGGGDPGKDRVPDDVGVGDEFPVRWSDGPGGLVPLTIATVTRVTAKLVHCRLLGTGLGTGVGWRFRRRDGLTTRRGSAARLCGRLYRRPRDDEGRAALIAGRAALIADIGRLLADRSARGLPMDRTARLLERVARSLAAGARKGRKK